MGIVNNQGVFIAPPLGEGEETTLTSFREDDDFSTDIFEESVVLPDFPNNIGVAFVRSSDSPADYLTISLKGNNTSTVYIDNTANNANLSVSGDVFIGYNTIPNFISEKNSYFGYSLSSFTSNLFVNGIVFARQWVLNNARLGGRTRFGLNTIEIDSEDNSISGVGIITANVGTITTITGNNLYYQGISTFRDGPLLIGTGTSTGTEFQPLQISGGVYISDSVGIGTTNPGGCGKLEVLGTVCATDFNSTSDKTLKTNIQIINNPLDKVLQLNGYTFNWKETNKESIGVIAQELEEILPQLVSGLSQKSVNYNGIIAVLIESIKELNQKVEGLTKELKSIKIES